ncbi:MAG TPA: carboxypeptidase-like regulatory domain-containing protein, partial [Bryobacteraceae bacterium]|nr:carboxypeptidase-like regulatory domain-containing protein [Bryobacteraceae bacterium]
MRLALAAFLIASAACVAQQRAQLAGIVRDPTDAVVPGAMVSVVHLDTGVRRVTQSNGEGFYAISSLAAGNYKITVRKDGFRTVAQLGVLLEALETARFDFSLPIGSAHETVTVESNTPLLNIEDLTTTLVLNAARARDLPVNGRALQGLIDLAPGVLATPATSGEAGQFSANGQRPNTNYFTVDGVSANNGVIGSGLPGQFSGGALPAMTAIGSLHNLATASELEEVRVQTSTFAPEYGRLPGAQVAVITRSGSNSLHGDAYGYLRDRSLAANDWFANRAAMPSGEHRLRHFGGSLSGPIRKDSIFGLIAIERLRLRRGVSFLSAMPSDAARRTDADPASRILNAFPRATGPELGNLTSEFPVTMLSSGGLQTVGARVVASMQERGSLFVRYSNARSDNET